MNDVGVTWKRCPGIFSDYSVSSVGEVLSKRKGVPLKPGNKNGGRGTRSGTHLTVSLSVDGKVTRWLVHRLVLWAFVGPPRPGEVARHLNGDAFDNRLCNLAWGSWADNVQDAIAHGTYCVGEKNAQAKLNAAQVQALRDDWEMGMPQSECAKKYGISTTQTNRIVRGLSWRGWDHKNSQLKLRWR